MQVGEGGCDRVYRLLGLSRKSARTVSSFPRLLSSGKLRGRRESGNAHLQVQVHLLLVIAGLRFALPAPAAGRPTTQPWRWWGGGEDGVEATGTYLHTYMYMPSVYHTVTLLGEWEKKWEKRRKRDDAQKEKRKRKKKEEEEDPTFSYFDMQPGETSET